jgi:hypothetical protein
MAIVPSTSARMEGLRQGDRDVEQFDAVNFHLYSQRARDPLQILIQL